MGTWIETTDEMVAPARWILIEEEARVALRFSQANTR